MPAPMARKKLLSDFDGVWTDHGGEADAVLVHAAREAGRHAGIDAARAEAHFAGFLERVLATPESHGWAPDGRISAYVDEDPFCRSNAIAGYLERADDPLAQRYRQAILAAGFARLGDFADRCFLEATERFRLEHPPAMVPGAAAALAALFAASIDVVVVSNSPPAKIEAWFRALEVPLPGPEAFRVRGSARKFLLGAGQHGVELGSRRVFVDRPHYRAILADERPDFVVGDVFSLDLALPHHLRNTGQPGGPGALILRRHGHTPAWVLDGARGGPIDHLIEHPRELAPLIAGPTPSSPRG